MTPTAFIPDDVIEAIVTDRPVAAPYRCLVGVADDVRALGSGPAPGPSAELAALLRGNGDAATGTTAAAAAVGVAPRRFSLAAKVAGLGIVAKVALGTSVAAAGVVGAGATGALPDGVDEVVRSAVEAVSPFELDDGSSGRPASDPEGRDSERDDAGTGADGGDGGGAVDAEDGRGDGSTTTSNGVDEPPGQTGDTGLTRANETPAAPHAPDTTPEPSTTVTGPTPSSTVPPARPDDPGRPTAPTADTDG